MTLQNYSGGPNPFIEASKLLGRLGKGKQERVQTDILKSHMEMTAQAHQHAKELIEAHTSGAIEHTKTINKLAEPGTAVSVSAPGHAASYTKKSEAKKAEQAPEQAAEPKKKQMGHRTWIGPIIPKDPGTLEGVPSVKQGESGLEANPAYKEKKSRIQHFEEAHNSAKGNPNRMEFGA